MTEHELRADHEAAHAVVARSIDLEVIAVELEPLPRTIFNECDVVEPSTLSTQDLHDLALVLLP